MKEENSLNLLIEEIIREKRELQKDLKGAKKKVLLLLNSLDKKKDFLYSYSEPFLCQLDTVTLLIKALLHDIESKEREVINLQDEVDSLLKEVQEKETEIESLSMENEILEGEIISLKRKKKTKRTD